MNTFNAQFDSSFWNFGNISPVAVYSSDNYMKTVLQ